MNNTELAFIPDNITTSERVVIAVHTYRGIEEDGNVQSSDWDRVNTLGAALLAHNLATEQEKVFVVSSTREDNGRNVAELTSSMLSGFLSSMNIQNYRIHTITEGVNDSLAEIEQANKFRNKVYWNDRESSETSLIGVALNEHARVPGLYKKYFPNTFTVAAEAMLERYNQTLPDMSRIDDYSKLRRSDKIKSLINPKVLRFASNVLGAYKHSFLNSLYKSK